MECCDSDDEGNPTERTYRRYRNLFEGGAGIVDLEAITVQWESRSRKNQLSVMPRNQKALSKFVSELRKINDKTIFVWQLTHSGELSNPDFSRRVCVKPTPGFGGDVVDEAYVEKTIDQFVLSAKIARDCGADGIDFKNCHGYLDSQILRPYNDRKWKYGGPWENRTRFTLLFWANKNIRDRVTDMVAIGRQSLADGQLPRKLAEGREKDVKWCTACDNCIELLIRQRAVGCTTYAKEYSDALKKIRKEEGLLKEKRT